MSSCVSIEQRNPFMLQYISWPEFGLSMNIPVTATEERSTTINYATENAVLSLCSMNIAKNYWVTLKCSM